MTEMPERKKWSRTSASQIKAVARCEWRWIWEKLFGFRGPGSRATQRGQLIHRMLEDALIFGTPPGAGDYSEVETDLVPQDDWDRAPAIALKMLEHISLEPGTVPKEQVEHKMFWKPEGSPVYILGFVDLVDGVQEDGSVGLSDHKTRSRIGRYTPTAMQLRKDIQGLVYGAYAAFMARPNKPKVWFRHINGQTTGTITSTEVVAHWEPGEVTELFNEHVLPLIKRQKVLADSTNEELLVIEGNTQACSDFGGCPHKGRCLQHGILQDHPFASLFADKKETIKLSKELDYLFEDAAPETEPEYKFADNDIVQDATGSRHTVVERFVGPSGDPCYKLFNGAVCYERELEHVPDGPNYKWDVGAVLLLPDDTEGEVTERVDGGAKGLAYKINGKGYFESALRPIPAKATMPDPADGPEPSIATVPDAVPNPPDGTPMDEVVTQEVVAGKVKPPRTRGFKIWDKSVSTLSKDEAIRAQRALCDHVARTDACSDYLEKTARPTSGRVTLAHNKKDIALIFKLLALPDLTEDDILGYEAALNGQQDNEAYDEALNGPPEIAQDMIDADRAAEGMPATAAEGMPATAASTQITPVTGTLDPSAIVGEITGFSVDGPVLDRISEIRRLEEENTELRSRLTCGAPSVLYVNCRPKHHVPAFTWGAFVDQFIENKGYHPMCHHQYGETGYHLMAEALRQSKAKQPSELYLDLGMLGGREAFSVLESRFNVVVRSERR